MTFDTLAQLIAQHVDCEPEAIKPEVTFESLGIDSLDTVELMMKLEEVLGTELELDEKLETVGDLLTFIQSKEV